MSRKIIPLNAKDRALNEIVDEIIAILHNSEEIEVQSLYVRLTTKKKEEMEDLLQIQTWHSNIHWEDIGMIETEIETMRHEYYNECMEEDE